MTWKNILSEYQNVTLENYCSRIGKATKRYMEQRPASERGEYRKSGIRCAEALVKIGINADDIKKGLKCYVRWESDQELDAATEMVDIAFANIRRDSRI